MVLAYHGRAMPYSKLIELLQIGPIGAPRHNILNLSRLKGISVVYREAALPLLAQYLKAGLPIIAFVDTGELAYWTETTNHAVVVIGIEGDDILVHDPAFEDVLIRISVGEFDLAWLNGDNACAVITRRRS